MSNDEQRRGAVQDALHGLAKILGIERSEAFVQRDKVSPLQQCAGDDLSRTRPRTIAQANARWSSANGRRNRLVPEHDFIRLQERETIGALRRG